MAIRLAPFPDAIDERVAAKLMPILAFLCEILLDRVLYGDSRVIGAGQPQRVVTLHPARAHDDVLQRDVERVPEMKLAGDVRWRDDDREDFARARGIGLEVVEVDPQLKPPFFSRLGIESFGQIHRYHPVEKRAQGALRSNHIVLPVASQARGVDADASGQPTACKIEAVNNIVRMLGFGDGPYFECGGNTSWQTCFEEWVLQPRLEH